MTRSTYIQAVFSHLKRLTRRERESIRAELDGHMEDRFEALRELGYDEREAEERTIAAMGDPAEVGRELNRQYPFRWLIVKWAAQTVTALLALFLLSGWGDALGNLAGYAQARLCPGLAAGVDWAAGQSGREVALTQTVDRRMEAGDLTVRVWQVGLEHPSEREMAEKGGMTYVTVHCWGGDPWTQPAGYRITAVGSGGVRPTSSMRMGLTTCFEIPVTYGGTVEITCESEYGLWSRTMTVELPWEELP